MRLSLPTRALVWAVLTTLVVLGSRTLAYALTPPSPAAARLLGQLGGPGPVLVAVTALGLALVLGGALLWLASVGAGERAALAGVRALRLRLRPVLVRALALFAVSSLVFAALESYIHYRAGLGFHWLHCLLGPVHRDALPLLGSLSLLAAAVHGAAAHLLGAVEQHAGRLVGLRIRPPVPAGAVLAVIGRAEAHSSTALLGSRFARGPPPLVV
jgi:hypothetical protein